MPSPIVLLLAAFAAGVVGLSACPDLPPWPLAIALAGAIVAAFALRGRRGAPAGASGRFRRAALALAILATAACGFGYAAWRAELRLADELPAQWEGQDLQITGVVDELPRAALGGVRFTFAVERVVTHGVHVPARVSLAWYAPAHANDGEDGDERGTVPLVHAGERWMFTVRLLRPHGSVNPAGFDLEGWLFAHGIRANGYVRPDVRHERLDAFAGRPLDHVERVRERVRDRILGVLAGASYAGVLAALTIGDQRAIPQAQWTVFNRTGVAHLVSISGLHVTAFALIAAALAFAVLRRWTWLTTRCPARRIAVLGGLAASAAYVALAGAEVPAVRTLSMLTVSAVGLWLARPGTGRLVWLWSLAAVIALDPFAPLVPGFWLSFGAVAVLIFACGSRLRAAPAGRFGVFAQSLREAARAQWAVTVGLVPLTLALFGQVSLVSPLANAVAIPAVTFVVVPLALVAVALPFDAPLTVAHGALSLLMAFLEPLSALPAAAWQQHAPVPWSVGVGIAGVCLLISPRGLPGRGLGLALLAPLLAVAPVAPPHGAAVVTVLDVGQGLALSVRTATHALVYDAGPRFSPGTDAGGRIVAPFLRASGMPRLAGLVVSHADTDHSGGALSLLAAIPAAWLSSSLPEESEIVARQREERGEIRRCQAGQRWEWDGVQFAIVHPSAQAYQDPLRKTNDLSCVLRIDAPGGRVLVAGDIEAKSEREILARGEVLAADVLVMPHHGSRTSSTPAFIDAVAPRVAIVAAGYRNRFGHPRPDVVARYASRGIATPRTDQHGAIVIAVGSSGIAVEHSRATLRRYWHARPGVP